MTLCEIYFPAMQCDFQRALSIIREKSENESAKQQQWDQFVESLMRAVSLNPARADYWYELGTRNRHFVPASIFCIKE